MMIRVSSLSNYLQCHSLYKPRELVFSDMSLDNFFNIVYDMAIILAVVTLIMGFLYLYIGREET